MRCESKRRELSWKLVPELHGPLRRPWRGGGGGWLDTGTTLSKACGFGGRNSAGLCLRAAGQKDVKLLTALGISSTCTLRA